MRSIGTTEIIRQVGNELHRAEAYGGPSVKARRMLLDAVFYTLETTSKRGLATFDRVRLAHADRIDTLLAKLPEEDREHYQERIESMKGRGRAVMEEREVVSLARDQHGYMIRI